MTKNFKKRRYEDTLLGIINTIFRSQISDKRLNFVSVTKVELNADYSVALVYWDTFDDRKKDDSQKAVKSVVGRVRKLLAETFKVKHIPKIVFKYDGSYHDAKHITNLIKNDSYVEKVCET